MTEFTFNGNYMPRARIGFLLPGSRAVNVKDTWWRNARKVYRWLLFTLIDKMYEKSLIK